MGDRDVCYDSLATPRKCPACRQAEQATSLSSSILTAVVNSSNSSSSYPAHTAIKLIQAQPQKDFVFVFQSNPVLCSYIHISECRKD
jgi:hypothetical protein